MQDSTITVQGRVASAPEMKVSKNKNPFATFRVASTPRRQVAGAPGTYEDGETSWFTVFAWGNLGANVLSSVEKGQPVVVHGRLSAREFKRDDGTPGTSVSIVANGIGHDLSWGRAAYEKVSKPSYGSGDRLDDALETMSGGGVDESADSASDEGGDRSHGFGDPQRDDYLLAERPADASSGPLVDEPAA